MSSAALAALASGTAALAQLVELDLDIPWFVNTSGWDLAWASQIYLGTAGAGRIDPIEDTLGDVKGIQFELPAIVDVDLATALIGMPLGREARVLTAIFSTANYTILDAIVDFAGRLDVPSIAEGERDETTGEAQSVIRVTAEHIGVDLLRPSGLLYTNADQLRLYPGDRSFEFVVDQSDATIIWPAASFFRK